ncbi:MAG: PHP domain-containing protein [Eubacteriales bacterium]
MYNIIADMHTHTIASDHAFSTLKENITEAKQIGLFAIAATDHGPALPDSPHDWHAGSVSRTLPGLHPRPTRLQGDRGEHHGLQRLPGHPTGTAL